MHKCFRKSTFKVLMTLSVLLCLAKFGRAQQEIPQTPCKTVFNYRIRNGTNEVYGYLKFANDFSGDYQLKVRMSVARKISGNIVILRLPSEDDIQCGADLQYEVVFPPCEGLIPALTFVKFNNKIYCTGPPQGDIHGRGASNFMQQDGLVTDMHENSCESSTIGAEAPQIPRTEQPVPPTSTLDSVVQKKKEGCGIIEEYNGREHYPWLATVYYRKENFNGSSEKDIYYCSATLIAESFVLTVAHCVNDLKTSKISVRLGRNNIKAIAPSESTTIRQIKDVFMHPMYAPPTSNDIAILELDRPVPSFTLIRPACLWNENKDLNRIVNERSILIGWGAGAKPEVFIMPIASHKGCILSNPKFRELVNPTNFCAGFRNGSAPCFGNSGGSLLLLREDGRYYLRGLASHALWRNDMSGCDKFSYTIFTDVAVFDHWISSIVNRL